MKLWHIAQWGNKEEGPDGEDTQCIVSAPDLTSAIEIGEFQFRQMFSHFIYRKGKADVVYLMGNDGRPDGKPQIVIHIWRAHNFNLMHYPSWYRHPDTDEWLDQKTMYGE